MKEVTIREMQVCDLQQVCEIERRNFSMPWSEISFFESMERKDTVFLVALHEDAVVGYIGCYCIDGAGEITNVAVKEDCRRMGVAGMLMEALYKRGQELETMDFFLEVRESNHSAISLYSRQGFVKEGVRKNFYERPIENAVIMWKHGNKL